MIDKTERMEEVLALVRAKAPAEQRATLERFVNAYYDQVAPEDLIERRADDLYGAALSLWNFARKRMPGQPKVRAFNPTVEEHGWQSTHTVIEVVNNDMPFLVDSVTMEINRHSQMLHLIIHPILRVRRQAEGELTALVNADEKEARAESFMHVEVDRLVAPQQLAQLAEDVLKVLGDVRVAVEDWPKMMAQVNAVLEEIEQRNPPVAPDESAEGKAFLRWLADDHFTFLGYRCYDLTQVNGEDALSIVPESGLGILREREGHEVSGQPSILPANQRAFARLPRLVFVTKANSKATVHRSAYLDYIGVKRFNERGEVCGEHRFLGLFTSTAYSAEPEFIPYLRRKTANVIARSGIAPGSHAGKTLLDIIENYPRDELFQIGEMELLKTVTAIVHLGERQRLRLFVRRDPFDRFISCLIYAPRENYNTDLRQHWQRILQQAFNGTGTDYNALLSQQSVLVRTLITVRTTPGLIPDYDIADLERRLILAARRWEDDLQDALREALGEARGGALFQRYQHAFPAAYSEDFAARSAVPDIQRVERLLAGEPFSLSLYRPLEAAPNTLRFKLVHKGKPVALSDSLPMLECMGLRVLDERPYHLSLAGEETVWIHDFGLMSQRADFDLEIEQLHEIFEDAFSRIFRGEIERDDFNRLVIAARLPAEEIVILRAYAKYMRQIGFPLSQSFIEATLANNAALAQHLIALFKLRFDPAQAGAFSETAEGELIKEIRAALEHVQNLNEDRVLRQYLNLIRATTRTNFWRVDGLHGPAGKRRSFLSFKFDPSKVPGLPEPKPMFEIFVYSPRFEGVHLRGGKVARGGLRWSDRPEDFRTEILGLVKAQMVKNTVIVPVGSKGGFVLKRPISPADREAWLKEGVECYKDYLRALLDLTDNRVQTQIVPPPQVRRHDPDDPYLVVAADKGTATFSDYANAMSREYGFWLDDAFASGGSAGYDHKGMGITARGAWESVKRHFRELGVNTQTTAFTVTGIGDMSGDVFGNGMLLSKHIRLLAAFDHRHIFLDPNPDAALSYVERERLFNLPRSSWADYNADLISAGGGIYPRTAKSIPLSPEVKQALGIEADELTPTELVNAILKAPVDLLYNGGIGTYVKSTRETHAQAGDRANDAVRVNGNELRCKVVAEGGNLGCTQLGRIEYALNGGRINTDAIDNSAGVSTSDHEVNIKILLALVMAAGELTEKQRNALLAEMTDEVAVHVLRDNYSQTQWLSISGRQAFAQLDAQQRFISFLGKQGRLNRKIEFLPSDEELAERRAKQLGLTSPERAVLLAYSKIWLFDELLASPLPDDPWVATALERYFPKALRERYADYMPKHPLRREIIATHVTNSMLNRVGGTFVHQLMETTGFSPAEIVRAYLLAREVFRVVPLWLEIQELDNQVADEVQAELVTEVGRVLMRATAWFLRSRRLGEDMAANIAHFGLGIEALADVLLNVIDPAERAQIDALVARYKECGVPEALAMRVACRAPLFATLDIVEVVGSSQQPVERVARVYFDLATKLELPALREQIAALPGDQHWQALARGAMLEDLTSLQRTITGEVLSGYGAAADPAALVNAWQTSNQRALERTQQLLAELKNASAMDVSMLSVALRELRHLA
ncbi:MAG: NAD-glutamate dehydrogenase [Acidobacteria bacterium]|nr:NAD-glutamate dehydrogenase [Acidobacteriota bacterium]